MAPVTTLGRWRSGATPTGRATRRARRWGCTSPLPLRSGGSRSGGTGRRSRRCTSAADWPALAIRSATTWWRPAATGPRVPPSRSRRAGPRAATSWCCGASGTPARFTQDAFFVLRAAVPGRRSKLAMVAATYTWQEYNDWGGGCGYFSDEYVDHTADPLEVREKSFRPRLGFHRPWSRGLIRTPVGAPRIAQPPPPVGAAVGIPAADWAISHGYSVWTVAAGWARYDALTFRWLEANGYEPELLSQWDLDRDPGVLDGYGGGGHHRPRRVLDGRRPKRPRPVRRAGRRLRPPGRQHRVAGAHGGRPCAPRCATSTRPTPTPSATATTSTGAPGRSRPTTSTGRRSPPSAPTASGACTPAWPVCRPGGRAGSSCTGPATGPSTGADVYYGDVLGASIPLVGYETDGVAYTFRRGLPFPTGEDGTPKHLEILALTPVTLEEEDHGQAGNLISIADGDLAFAGRGPLRRRHPGEPRPHPLRQCSHHLDAEGLRRGLLRGNHRVVPRPGSTRHPSRDHHPQRPKPVPRLERAISSPWPLELGVGHVARLTRRARHSRMEAVQSMTITSTSWAASERATSAYWSSLNTTSSPGTCGAA